MFNDKKNLPENDPLKAQFDGIDKEVRASAELKQAAKTGVPLRKNGAVSTAVHVRRFGKAVAAYAMGILLFLGVVAVFPGLWESDPISSPGMNVTTTDEQDVTDANPVPIEIIPLNEAFSDEIIKKIDAAYMEIYNKSLQFEQTEQHAVWYLGTYDDGIVFYKKFVPPNGMHISYVEELEVADKVFSLSSHDTLCVYKDGAVKQVYDAYENGEMSEENVLLILEQYGKLMNRLLNWSNAVRPIE